MTDSLERLYRAVPHVACRGLCTDSCGPVPMSEAEHMRVRAKGVDIPVIEDALTAIKNGDAPTCPALVNNRCSVYDVRPLICRMWGAVESMPCPHGCTVTPGLLVDDGAKILIRRSIDVGGQPMKYEGP